MCDWASTQYGQSLLVVGISGEGSQSLFSHVYRERAETDVCGFRETGMKKKHLNGKLDIERVTFHLLGGCSNHQAIWECHQSSI